MTTKITKTTKPEVIEAAKSETTDLALLTESTISQEGLAKLKSDCLFLTVKGLEDKAGYKECQDARMLVKRMRISIENRYKQIAKGFEDRKKLVKSAADSFIVELEKIELHLKHQQKVIDDEVARLKEEKLRKRIADLSQYGALRLTPKVIESMNQADFEEHLTQVKASYELELQRRAEMEQARKEREEALALAKQNAAPIVQASPAPEVAQPIVKAAAPVQPPIPPRAPEAFTVRTLFQSAFLQEKASAQGIRTVISQSPVEVLIRFAVQPNGEVKPTFIEPVIKEADLHLGF